MILPHSKEINYDKLMETLYLEIQDYDSLPVINQIKKEQEKESSYRVLISTVLSSRTKDEVTAVASERLFKRAPEPHTLSWMEEEEIVNLIYPVGFYRIKAKNIKNIARILIEEYGGEVPDNIDELMKLPGVGRKTANLVLGIAFNIDTVTVDTHVHRISNRIGIVRTRTPAETEQDLMKVLPQKHWISFNTYLVLHGQNICKPISPWCSRCKIISFCQQIGVERCR
ncbi:MAG: endonuclease III [Atribacterota bacterium]